MPTNRIRTVLREAIWPILLGAALLLRMLVSSESMEAHYSRGIFLYIRQTLDIITGMLPFPLIYLLLGLISLIAILQLIRIWRLRRSVAYRIGRSFWSWGKGAIILAFFFTLMWGYNYDRIPFEDQVGLEISPLTLDELICALEETTVHLENYRLQVPGAGDSALSEVDMPADVELRGRRGLENVLESLHFPTQGVVRARLLKPKGILLRFNSSGVYLPWTGEGHVDAGLHPLQIPFVMIHEMAHGYGFTDEGTCNFLGVLGGLSCKAPFIRYSVLLGYWRYLASEVRYLERDQYDELFQHLSPGIRADLRAIYEYQDAYPEIFPKLRYVAYDTYLKAQGIEEGILNYDRILVLMKAWQSQRQRPDF